MFQLNGFMLFRMKRICTPEFTLKLISKKNVEYLQHLFDNYLRFIFYVNMVTFIFEYNGRLLHFLLHCIR